MQTLTVKQLNYAYGKTKVLHHVNITALKPGSLIALLGPNAAGKSTLFKCLAGIYKPQSGIIELGGENLAQLSNKERLNKVCFMPQFFHTNAALTVFEVVLMSYKQLQGWNVSAKDRNTVSEAIDKVGIAHLANAYIAELSGGQAQMVSLCQSLVRKADVYLFDEPTSALDLRHQLEGLTHIRQAMHQRNTIGIAALHDINLAARFADYFLLLGHGQLLAQGHLQDLLHHSALAKTYGVHIELMQSPKGTWQVYADL